MEKFYKDAGSNKFNGITWEGRPAIPIKSHKNQCREHMIRNGMGDVLSITDSRNKEKKWYLILYQYIFTLEYMKHHLQNIHKDYKADNYVVQNLTWSGVYPRSTL